MSKFKNCSGMTAQRIFEVKLELFEVTSEYAVKWECEMEITVLHA